jgi:MFS superfamily sulfate permease-like transporter
VKSIPPLIPLLLLTVLISVKSMEYPSFGPLALTPKLPDTHHFWTGFAMLVLPQIASMGIANIMSGIIGGAPMCHGSGGLTAHSKFGATSERSGYIIGLLLIGLAILFGGSSVAIISAFPKGILGILLCYVGIEHSLFIRDILRDRVALLVAVTTAVLGFITGNLTLGFLTGIGIHYAFKGLLMTFKYPVRN